MLACGGIEAVASDKEVRKKKYSKTRKSRGNDDMLNDADAEALRCQRKTTSSVQICIEALCAQTRYPGALGGYPGLPPPYPDEPDPATSVVLQ